jgi:hypothetical protein
MHRSRPKLPLPTCETCLNVFTAAYARVNSLRVTEKRLSSDEVLALAEGRSRAFKFGGEWVCPRCTTLTAKDGALLLFEQVYPNRQARRAGPQKKKVEERAIARAAAKAARKKPTNRRKR